jgi:ATP adenylyltransferase
MRRLWAPWRSKYIHAPRDRGRCVFCDAAASSDDRASLVLHRGRFAFVLLNAYPYTSGHLMVAPYEHVSRLSHASQEASQEMMTLTRQAEAIIQAEYCPDGLNVGMNLGQAAGAGIEEHIHMHVLPRWLGDANFITTVGEVRVLPEALEKSYSRLFGKFQSPEAPLQ